MKSKQIVLGLTGISGSGKTTVSDTFREQGIPVIDCDKIARLVVEKGTPCLNEILACFSDDILTEKGDLDRKKLGAIVFSDKERKRQLEKIINPYIFYQVFAQKNTLDDALIVIDAPTLFESGLDDVCDVVLSVVCDCDICAERISKRDGISLENAYQRLSNQHDKAFFINNSAYYIDNTNELKDLKRDALTILDKLTKEINDKH